MTVIEVAASRRYDVVVGADTLNRTGELACARFEPCRTAILTDDTVGALYGERTQTALEDAGFRTCLHTFPHGERSKTMDTLADMLEFLAENGLTRGDAVAALGGGVTGDMAGLAAALYARGLRLIQIPTTLLAAVDSSVGGKTAVNLRAGKNLAGTFYQPSLVVCDTDILNALPDALLSDGAAEIVKYGLLTDADLFATLRSGRLRAALETVVARCVAIKRDIVAEDEFDTGRRQLLNLGHTLGHAVERRSDYRLSHGQSVSIGMMLIARAACRMGYAEDSLVTELEEALTANGLPTRCPYAADELQETALLDKKRRGDHMTLVVPRSIGRCELVEISADDLKNWIRLGAES